MQEDQTGGYCSTIQVRIDGGWDQSGGSGIVGTNLDAIRR